MAMNMDLASIAGSRNLNSRSCGVDLGYGPLRPKPYSASLYCRDSFCLRKSGTSRMSVRL